MKYTVAITITAASLLAIAFLSADAGQGKGSGSQKQVQQTDQVRSQAHHTDMHNEQARAKDRAQSAQGQALGDRDIYGGDLMTAEERERYREQLQLQMSEMERQQFQLRHEEAMQQRARQQGKDLVPPGQGPVYGGELMTVQERNEYREQLRHIETDEERTQFKAQHRAKMDQRAKALQLEIEEAE